MKLILYVKNVCPYCVKVRRFIRENKIDIPLKVFDKNPEFRNELKEKGGKVQVPALAINEKIMYESDDIINWLKENYRNDT